MAVRATVYELSLLGSSGPARRWGDPAPSPARAACHGTPRAARGPVARRPRPPPLARQPPRSGPGPACARPSCESGSGSTRGCAFDAKTSASPSSSRSTWATLRSTLDRIEGAAREVASYPSPALQILRAPDLLVGWYDDWVLAERERLRHRRVRALEALAAVRLEAGRAADSIGFAGERAARLEPLLESAVTLHVRALLLDGDLTAALAEYRAFRERLRAELGVTPPPALTDLLREAKALRSAVAPTSAAPIVPDLARVRHGGHVT